MRGEAFWGRMVAAGLILSAAAQTMPVMAAEYEWLERPALTGDRADLVARGVDVRATLTQVGQGVVDGGKDDDWEYGGRGNLTINLDTQKLNLWPGGFFTLEVEGNFNRSVNGSTGALMAVNSNQLFPEPGGENFNVPQLSFAQFVSPYAGAVVGKLDTTSGDMNAFAHGKGDEQFFNMALSINPVAVIIPYSTLGAGIIVLPTKDPAEAILQFSALQASGRASTTGFDDFDSEWIGAAEGRVRTDFFGLTGHQLVGAFYSSREYTSLDQRLGHVVETQSFARENGSWGVYYNFDQYLYEFDRQAETGVGVFGRFGASDGGPNVSRFFYSAGVGGKGIVPGRERDRFGLGAYFIDVSNPTFEGPLGTRTFLSDEWGFEAFYNIALTGWLLLTPDIQVIGPSQNERITSTMPRLAESISTATVIGFRLQIVF